MTTNSKHHVKMQECYLNIVYKLVQLDNTDADASVDKCLNVIQKKI